MVKDRIIFICISVLCITNVEAQRLIEIFDSNAQNLEMFKPERYLEISGSPYYGEDYVIGSLILSSGAKFESIQMRYNAYEDALLVVLESELMLLMDPDKLDSFWYEYDGNTTIFKSMKVEENTNHFYRLVYDGNSKYVVREIAVLGQGKNNAGSYGDSEMQGQSFKLAENHYVVFKDGESTKFKRSKKSIIEALGGDSDTLEAFVKKEKLKLAKEADIVKLLTYYDSLGN